MSVLHHCKVLSLIVVKQGVGAVGGHKEGLVPRAVALLHHLIHTSQHKGSLTVTQSGEQECALTISKCSTCDNPSHATHHRQASQWLATTSESLLNLGCAFVVSTVHHSTLDPDKH